MFVVRYKHILARPIYQITHLQRAISITSTITAQNVSQPKNRQTGSSQNPKQIEAYTEPLTEDAIQKITNTDHIMYVTKIRQKKPERKPLLREFFIGDVDRDLLAYPQVMTQKEVAAMEQLIDTHREYFDDGIGKTEDRLERDISSGMLSELRRLRSFGANVEQRFGGMGNFASEMSWLSETEALDLRSFFVLGAHRLAVEAIRDHGSENHHIEFMARMAKG